jgi:hypothetical protein
MPAWLTLAIVAFGIAGLVSAWRARRSRSAHLDSFGRAWNVQRWEGESEEHYLNRIRDRIMITGGRTWSP